jgi:hypothetical protein
MMGSQVDKKMRKISFKNNSEDIHLAPIITGTEGA